MGERGGEGQVPGLRDHYVVEGGISLAEAGEADFDDHCWCWRRWRGGIFVENLIELIAKW